MTCTQLARKLKRNRRDLARLARRHSKFLNEFGVVGTVPKTSTALGGRPTEELLFNRPQVLYLISKSACSVSPLATQW